MDSAILSNVIAYVISLFVLRVALGRHQFERFQILLAITAGVGVMLGNAISGWIFRG